MLLDFSNAVDLSANFQPFDGTISDEANKHPHHLLWMGRLVALEMMLPPVAFQYFGTMEGILWAVVLVILTLCPTYSGSLHDDGLVLG